MRSSNLCFAFNLQRSCRSAVAPNRNLARLHRLGNFALEIDGKQTILQRSILNADVIGELEPAFKAAGSDASMQIFKFAFVGLTAFNDENIALLRDIEITVFKTRDCHHNLICVVAGFDDIVRRPCVNRL